MSWKPSRSSGIMYDKYDRTLKKYENKLSELLPICNPIPFEKFNELSKCYYLIYKNTNNKRKALIGTNRLDDNLESFIDSYYLKSFKRYPHLLYKPFAKELNLI